MAAEKWDVETDFLVIGFGGAGACAALEALDAGMHVTVVDRFNGGGSTLISGGNIYTGDTPYQREAGYDDSPEELYNYLKLEVGDAISDTALRYFCDNSAADMAWLEQQGLQFNASACPYKTSYPVDKYYLYYSGNEIFSPYKEAAKPAPRGHRAYGKGGLAGANFFIPLRDSVIRKGAEVLRQHRLQKLMLNDQGHAIGAEVLAITSPWKKWLHRKLCDLEVAMRYLSIGIPGFSALFQRLYALLERGSTRRKIHARHGVVVATGGFAFNPEMLQQYAPKYASGTPLGRCSDDGSGIVAGMHAGGQVERMERVSAWRFINPPKAFCKGILVGPSGQRICNEAMYGSHIGEFMTESHNGQAWLIFTPAILKQAKQDLKPEYAQWFQTLPMTMNFLFNSKRGNSIEALAKRTGIDAHGLQETLVQYNALAAGEAEDPLHKPREFIEPLQGPFIAIDCSLASRKFVCPIVTFGGLKVDEISGEVLGADGHVIPRLYAAGRSAAGLSSGRYVSGLSISDCVFSGRRAARHMLTKVRPR